MKKTMAKITAFMLTAASLTALSANAKTVIDGRAELEAELDSKYTNACELTDLFGNFSYCQGAWIVSQNDTELNWMALQVIKDNLTLSTVITEGDENEIAEYLREQVGYPDVVTIRVEKWGGGQTLRHQALLRRRADRPQPHDRGEGLRSRRREIRR